MYRNRREAPATEEPTIVNEKTMRQLFGEYVMTEQQTKRLIDLT